MLRPRVIWITGASAGIGRALALEYARSGAMVAVSGRRAERLEEVVEEMEAAGGRGLAVVCDVADEAQVEDAVGRVVAAFGRLDVAVANAGFAVGGEFERIGAEEWRRQFDVNVVGVAATARHALPHLRRAKGRLVLVGSVAGFVPGPGAAPYSASKAAVRSIGQSLSVELHGSGVSCTTILPGFVESEIGQVDNSGRYRPEWKDRRPHRLMWPAERAARVMVRAIERRKREFVFTGHGRIAALLGRHFPGLVHLAFSRFTPRSSGRGREPMVEPP
jgi:NAD(P)-dependent dehydrogenase (short-subunit alcohol dehydrogenase family)